MSELHVQVLVWILTSSVDGPFTLRSQVVDGFTLYTVPKVRNGCAKMAGSWIEVKGFPH
jgi:hypothetical protein